MSSGFQGYFTIFEDDWYRGTVMQYPEAIPVETDNLTFGKQIQKQDNNIRSDRYYLTDNLLSREIKPEGDLTYAFRSSDILKILNCHFQAGTRLEEEPVNKYYFFPRANTLDYEDIGYQTPLGSVSFAAPYTLSILKNLGYDNNPNSFFFKHGIAHKLSFSCKVGDESKIQTTFKFRDLDYGTYVSGLPYGTAVGSYSAKQSFSYISATVILGDTSFPVSDFQIDSDQGVEERSILGRLNPENYVFKSYSCKGNFGFDLPDNAMDLVGSMFGTIPFSFTATLFNGTSDYINLSLPVCVRMPFDFKSVVGNLTGKIPFEAFAFAGLPPFYVTVTTDALFPLFSLSLISFDAIYGTRDITTMVEFDAGTGIRDLTMYYVIDRD